MKAFYSCVVMSDDSFPQKTKSDMTDIDLTSTVPLNL